MKKYIYYCSVIVLIAYEPQPSAPETKYIYQNKAADLKPSL
ncbi:MAG: hypothetical protein V3U75_08595 [Methylococcaceae bacterium]